MVEHPDTRAVLAVILAGGESRRMGGADKAALMLAGRPLHAHVVARLAPQAGALAVVAAMEPAWLGLAPGARWIRDAAGEKGPGAGLLGALRWLESQYGPDALMVTAPVDAPFLPLDLFERLDAARRKTKASAAIVWHKGGRHPVFGLWQAACASVVAQAMEEEQALHRIAQRAGAVECEAWSGADPDPFANLNTPEDVAAAEVILTASRKG